LETAGIGKITIIYLMKELYRAIGGLWEGLHFPCHGVADEIIRAGPLLLIVSHPEDNGLYVAYCGLS